MTLYEQRLKRTVDAIQMNPVDKIPFSYSGPAYLAKSQGVKIGKYLSDLKLATDTAINFVKQHPGIDSLHSPTMNPHALSTLWLSKVKVPGENLPDDELWQVDEQELMKFEDYEKIIKMGYGPWVDDFMKNRLDDPVSKMQSFIQSSPETFRRMAVEAEIPVVNALSTGTPFEGFCGGRQLMKFFIDLVEEPELVKAALDKAMDFLYGKYIAQLDAVKPLSVWIGGWRAAPELLAHDTWMEFVWPYLRKFIDATIERNVIPILHFDSCWDKEIVTLKELPPRKCLLMLDGATDMRKAREILDDRMCMMGDVPSTMLAFGSENEVYNYVTKLIDDVGPKTGLIISSGCDTPLNAKDENVNAMIQAAADYRI
ncbi:MAG: uroporphyrinogen decarboxylase family protein [Lachnospiraceae bacterium]|nr:uroporphyrinogen decarboxylase family protein [Lachnospiraceae bacterium]